MDTTAELEEPVPTSEGQPGDDEIEWTKGTSKNGTPFEYGVLKADILDADDPAMARAAFNRHQSEWNASNPPVASPSSRAAIRKLLTRRPDARS